MGIRFLEKLTHGDLVYSFLLPAIVIMDIDLNSADFTT
jgi:hypothetical protein